MDKCIFELRGKWRLLQPKKIPGFELNYDIPVLPTLSISHLLESPDLKKYSWVDLKLLRDKIKEII